MSDTPRKLGVQSKSRLVLRGTLILLAATAVWLWLASIPRLGGITMLWLGDVGILSVEEDGWHYWASREPSIRHWQILSIIAIVFGITYLHRRRSGATDAAGAFPIFNVRRKLPLLLTFLLLAGLSVYFLNACSNPIEKVGEPDKPLPEYHSDRPFLFIHMTPAHSRRAVSGLILAIYPDGQIIRATSESTIGESYIRGRLSTENLAQARRMLHDSDLLSTKPGGIVEVDGGAEHVGVRYGARVTSWGHTPGADYDGEFGAISARITRLREGLLALPVEDAKAEPAQEWHRWPTEFYEGQNDR